MYAVKTRTHLIGEINALISLRRILWKMNGPGDNEYVWQIWSNRKK